MIKRYPVLFLFLILNLCLQGQSLTGFWTENGAIWNTNVNGVLVEVFGRNTTNFARVWSYNDVLRCTQEAFSNPGANNRSSLGVYMEWNTEGGEGEVVFRFSEPILNPILHIDRLGGGASNPNGGNPISNSALMTLLPENLTLTRLSGNGNHFEVTDRTITRTINQVFGDDTTSDCGASSQGSAAGSVRINGYISEFSFHYQQNGENGAGADAIEVIVEVNQNNDFDNDGVPNNIDLDDDNDGITDLTEQHGDLLRDSDQDTLPDHLDLDSDNDGCMDVTEAGFTDADQNGTLGTLPDETSSTGLIINEIDGYTQPEDVDNNGISDFQQAQQMPILEMQPTENTVCLNDIANFEVTTNNQVLSYQWQISNDTINWQNLEEDNQFIGTNTDVLSIYTTENINSFYFRVLLSNSLNTSCDFNVVSNGAMLNIHLPSDAGENTSVIICEDNGNINLFHALNGTPDTNGYWEPTLQSGNNILNPDVDNATTYQYIVPNAICGDVFSEIQITYSRTPQILEIIKEDFSENNFFEIITDTNGSYEFSIDDVQYQNSNRFNDLAPGVYTVFVRDIYNCGKVSEEITILGYPKYFSPNNDGYHDFWTISNGEEIEYVSIFDRMGKLIKQLPSFGMWDGTYNGKLMPSSEYWFELKTRAGRIIKGHFSLIR